jgi:hypothetical protein
MIDTPRCHSWFRSLVLAALALAASGCSEELGPERMVVARVKGVVTYGRFPVRRGWIEFVPVDGTIGDLCSARIHEDGSFEADHVAVGVNLIRLANVPLGSSDVERLFAAYHSPIRRRILPQPTEPIKVDVFDETVHYKMRRKSGIDFPQSEAGETR